MPTTSPSSTPTPTPTPASPGFNGATSATNLDGTAVQINWALATSSAVTRYDIYQVSGSTLTYINSVSSPGTYFVHTGLTTGQMYSYVVRAVGTDITDSNITSVSAFTYDGLTSATVASPTSVTVNYPAAPAAGSIMISYKPDRSTTWTDQTVSRTSTSQTISGLHSGTTYTFKVRAVNAATTDGNSVTETLQTTSLTSTSYKGVMLVQAFGDASGAPTGTPQVRQVKITWPAFTGASSSTQYKVFRVSSGSTIDVTATTACTSSATTTCLVCTAMGTGAQTCSDINGTTATVGTSPAVYDYAVVLAPSGWSEELPASDSPYRIKVPIPPDNMVLVHRDSVNYEQCSLMSRTSDPLNHQRCSYTGIGATPYNSNPGNPGLGLSTSYFDFGYNLFADRWTAACNWTPQSNGGNCGASATPGNCFGTGAPAGTVGTVGNVYYQTNGGYCYYRTAGSWVDANGALTTAQRASIYTIDPTANGGYKPPIVLINQSNSYAVCQSQVDATYGAKRLLRQREFRALAAWPALSGEPGALADASITTVENGGHTTAGAYNCNSDTHAGVSTVAVANFATAANQLSRDSSGGPDSFLIGQLGTSNCVSRFGAQDVIGNVWHWVSDNMTCTAASRTCVGNQSTVDSGNGYSVGFDMNGTDFNNTLGPGGAGATADAWTISDGSNSTTYFNSVLGIPLVSDNGGNAISISSFSAKLHSDYFYWYPANGNTLRGLLVGGSWNYGANTGRWASLWSVTPSSANLYVGFRCALPAE